MDFSHARIMPCAGHFVPAHRTACNGQRLPDLPAPVGPAAPADLICVEGVLPSRR